MNELSAVTGLSTLDFDIPGVVTLSGFFYTVDFGYGVRPRIHSVRGYRCSCSLGPDCPAVDIVIEYLGCGGPAVPEAPDGYYPVAPIVCPICGAFVCPDVSLGSRQRGMGWRCQKGGASHYWQSLAHLKEKACTCGIYSFPHRKGTGACRESE